MRRTLNNTSITHLINKNFATAERGNFKKLEISDIDHFKSILPEDDVLTTDLEFYNTDWLRKYKGNSSLVVRPKTTEQVSKILKY